jgi:aerobic carbon-monoxide dehydrogenase medium subunit
MIPMAFEYERATSLDDALAKLRTAKGDGKLIAGGHSLVPLMKFRLGQPKVLIDIARIPGLSGIREAGGTIEIGAGTVHHDVASSALLRRQCPVVAEAAAEIGDQQVRNRGTLGGSLAHADPSADYPAVMLAMDAEIQLAGPNGPRTVRARDFFQGLFTVDLAADEIITGVRFLAVRAAAYAKLRQRASHFAIVGVAAALDVDQGTIRSARVGLTGAASYATRLTKVEEALAGKALARSTIDAAAALAGADLADVNADIHASEAYRRAMVPVFTRRALEGAMARTNA